MAVTIARNARFDPSTFGKRLAIDPPARARFEPEPTAPAQARALVRESARVWDCEELAETAQVVMSELVTNAVLHAGTDVDVAVSQPAPGRLRLEVADSSPQLPMSAEPTEAGVTGRGLIIVDAFAAAWGVRSQADGKVVWAELSV
jgi:anti-sigma regulatory factor (Ser/Thr protein kinase)